MVVEIIFAVSFTLWFATRKRRVRPDHSGVIKAIEACDKALIDYTTGKAARCRKVHRN
jgi:hypothetical protein